VYRGAGKVTFTPDQVEVWEDTRDGADSPWAPRWQPPTWPADGKWTAQATFSEPGTYIVRCRADDGALTGDDEIKVTVTK
jgi:plastocyanin